MLNVVDAPAISETTGLAELLDLLKVVSGQRNLGDLLQDLARHLHSVLDFDYLSVMLHDPFSGRMRMHVEKTQQQENSSVSLEFTGDEPTAGGVWQTQTSVLPPDLVAPRRFPRALPILRK